MPGADWLVQVPLSELVSLKNMTAEFEKLRAENAQLRREMEGLRCVQSETLQVLGDIRKEFRKAVSA